MTDMPLHPALVHIPLGLVAVLPVLTAGILGAWVLGWLPRRTWWLVVALQVVLLGTGLVAKELGEQDEETAEARVPESVIEAHAEAADRFLIGSGILLVLLAAAGAIPQERIARGVALAGVAGTLGTGVLGYQVGHAGGTVVYGDPGVSALAGLPYSQGGENESEEDDD